MSDSTSTVLPTCEYWIRVAVSLHLCVKKALLDILHDPVFNGLPRCHIQLYQRLYQFKMNLPTSLKKVIKSFQWEKMCHCCTGQCPNPCPRQGKTNAEDLDITCIVILITNLTTVPPPQGGWNNPHPNDVSVGAFILLARHLRNDINHCSVEDISSEMDFNDYWQRIESILVGLNFKNMNLFHELKTASLDAKTDQRMAASIEQIRQELNCQHNEISNQLDDLSNDIAQREEIEEMLILLEENLTRLSTVENQINTNFNLLHQFNCLQIETNILQDQRISKLEKNVQHFTEYNKDFEKLSSELRDFTKKKYGTLFVTFEKSTLDVPKSNKREDIVVGLSLIKDAEKAFFQAANDAKETAAETRMSRDLEVGIYRRATSTTIQAMRNELQEVSSKEFDYNDIITSLNDYVIISGAPGCGKTTLCETLAYNWACSKIWTSEDLAFRFVFILKFRELTRFKYIDNITADKILSDLYPMHFNHEQPPATHMKNTLLILDGFDECFNKHELLHSEYTSYTQALFDLLNPHNLKLPCARLVTSRPAACTILFKLMRSEQFTQARLFEVTGFSMENIKTYVRQYFENTLCHHSKHAEDDFHAQQQRVESFLNEVEHSDILRSMMTIPFYCNGVCCLMLDGEIGIASIPMTYTGLFSTLLTLFIRNHGLRNCKLSLSDVLTEKSTKEMIFILSKFAFSMELEEKITFTKNDFHRDEFEHYGNFEELVEKSGLIMKLVDQEEEPFYQFLHYSFHEFLVALYIFHFSQSSLRQRRVNKYVMSMVGGLAGGLVEGSKSSTFVKKFAHMFSTQHDDSSKMVLVDIEPLLGMNTLTYCSTFLAVVFEYQNKFHLKNPIILDMAMSEIDEYHIKYFLQNSNKFIMDNVTMVANQRNLYAYERLLHELTHTLQHKVLFAKWVSHFEPTYQSKKIHFDRIILFPSAGAHFIDDFISFYSNCTDELELFEFSHNVFKNEASNERKVFNHSSFNLTIHENISDFKEKVDGRKDKIEQLEHFCNRFIYVTISLHDNTDDAQYHCHNDDCVSDIFIVEVIAISKKYHDIKNLTFAASCIAGVSHRIAPRIHKLYQQHDN